MQRNSSQPAWPVWLSWLEYHPVDQKVMGLIPSQGTCLGCGFGPWLGRIWQATNRSFFLSPSPYLPLSLRSKICPGVRRRRKKGLAAKEHFRRNGRLRSTGGWPVHKSSFGPADLPLRNLPMVTLITQHGGQGFM